MRLLAFVVILFIATQQLWAQGNSIALKPATNYIINTSTKGKVDQDYMGQAISSDFNNNSIKKLTIKDVTSNGYTVEVVTTTLKSSVSLMDNVISAFDSDTSTDQSAIEFKNAIKKPKVYQIESNGTCTALNKENESKPASATSEKDLVNLVMGQFTGATTEESELQSYFMTIKKGLREGSTWSIPSTGNNNDSLQYEWIKTENGIATIKVTGKSNINNNVTLMGIDATAAMVSNITEIRKVNLASGMIQSKIITTNLNGNIDVMGMSIPITGNIESLTQIIEQ